MASTVELQTACSLWLRDRTAGLTRANGICQRNYSEYLGIQGCSKVHTFCQLNGTAQPSLALENLQETEKLEEPEREKAEEVIAGALGSMDLGE